MASALTLPELMTIVFEYNQSPKDLLNFALVCKAWTEWALDVRWRSCDVPMSAILHPLLSAANSIEDDIQQYFTDERWAVFMAISTRARAVVCDLGLPEDSWLPLKIRINNSAKKPFHRVQKLTVDLNQIDLWTVFLIFKFPALSLYRLCAGPWGDPGRKFTEFMIAFSEGIRKMPTITDVELDLLDFPLIPHLHSISKLRRLSCRQLFLNYSWWKALSFCENLTELRLEEKARAGDEGEGWEGGEVTFPALRSLLLDVREVIITTILSKSRFPVLDHLSFGSRSLSVDGMERARIHLKERSPNVRF